MCDNVVCMFLINYVYAYIYLYKISFFIDCGFGDKCSHTHTCMHAHTHTHTLTHTQSIIIFVSSCIANRIFTILLLFETIVFGHFIGAVGLGQVSNIIT